MEYPPDTLSHIVCGIMQFLRQNGQPEVDFFKGQLNADFRSALDAEMKRLKQAGIGSDKRIALEKRHSGGPFYTGTVE